MKASNLITHLEKKGVSKEVTMVVGNKEYSVEVVSSNPDRLILSGEPLAKVPEGDDEEVTKEVTKKVTKEKK